MKWYSILTVLMQFLNGTGNDSFFAYYLKDFVVNSHV